MQSTCTFHVKGEKNVTTQHRAKVPRPLTQQPLEVAVTDIGSYHAYRTGAGPFISAELSTKSHPSAQCADLVALRLPLALKSWGVSLPMTVMGHIAVRMPRKAGCFNPITCPTASSVSIRQIHYLCSPHPVWEFPRLIGKSSFITLWASCVLCIQLFLCILYHGLHLGAIGVCMSPTRCHRALSDAGDPANGKCRVAYHQQFALNVVP